MVFKSIMSGTSNQFLSPGHVSMAQGGDARQSLANRPRVGALRALAPAWHGDFGCHMASPVGFFLNPNEQLFSQYFSTMFSAQLVVLIVLSSIF